MKKKNEKPIPITRKERGVSAREYYQKIKGILSALRQAEKKKLRGHKDALKILKKF